MKVYLLFLFLEPQIRKKHMVCSIVLWIVTSEPIGFGIKYPYICVFSRSCNIYMQSLSKLILIIGIAIMPPALPSVYTLLVIKVT